MSAMETSSAAKDPRFAKDFMHDCQAMSPDMYQMHHPASTTYTLIAMKLLPCIAAILFSSPTFAGGVFQYVEEGNDKIVLSVRCKADDVYWCNCAIAGGDIAESLDDAFMCWNIEGDKIIFTNSKRRIEKRVDEIKTEIEPTSRPPSVSPRPENPNPSEVLSGSIS